jgi:hypothetical protein
LQPVPWGDAPWLPRLWAQTNDPNRDKNSSRKGAKTQREEEG